MQRLMWLGLVSFLFRFSFFGLLFLGGSPWTVHGPLYGGVCELTAQPLLVLDFQSAPEKAVVVHWGAVKSITPGHPPRICRRMEPAP